MAPAITRLTHAAWLFRLSIRSHQLLCRAVFPDLKALEQVITNAQRIRHNRQRWIHGSTRREKAAVDHVKVVEIMRSAVHIKRRGLRVVPKSNASVLMSNACQRNPLANIEAAAKQAVAKNTVRALPDCWACNSERSSRRGRSRSCGRARRSGRFRSMRLRSCGVVQTATGALIAACGS